MLKERFRLLTGLLVWAGVLLVSSPAFAAAQEAAVAGGTKPWWFWPLVLFVFCFVLGVIAVLAGVGGGVLYVPLVSGFFPFHIDFVRGAGLMVALAGALAAGPGLLKRNFASLRLAMPVALIASTCAILGAMLGLYLSALNPAYIQTALGATIVGIARCCWSPRTRKSPLSPTRTPWAWPWASAARTWIRPRTSGWTGRPTAPWPA